MLKSDPSETHIAIIMDGNGRWAQTRNHSRIFGHIRGCRTAKNIVEHATRIKLGYLTLFAFSTENWKRPQAEVSTLMRLLVRYLERERRQMVENNICFRWIGSKEGVPSHIVRQIEDTQRETHDNKGMVLTFAFNYGGRSELVSAAQTAALMASRGELDPSDIDENWVSQRLPSSPLPDPDLIIRTSGEFRLSNFFLWQAAYAELWVTDTMWPDFSPRHLDEALRTLGNRHRRFGGVEQTDESAS